ncbi:hypothetical protein FB45DRAFT_1056475 [Roridomyces roridus]|uniref:Uncharacterized protein n=1 Tax=Roridomyces roridus TaxID=1738132 RepID=A0AAD7BZZ4_9AGAR|nr:hypothetical protein FB45DRAFT_1009645 [Roridomyces roridus]KAJ7634425.1 hypothetical protein FB45DRAFT_1056475 [Roridomyces roridus]
MPTITPAALEPRSVALPPVASPGEHASFSHSTTHTHGPTPTVTFKSDRQHKASAGLIAGVSIGIIVFLAGLFFIRYLFVRRRARRLAATKAAGPGVMTMPADTKAPPSPPPVLPSAPDAVELGHYPPTGPRHVQSGSGSSSWSTPFSPPTASAAPGPTSSPAARQAYLAAELRAAQAQLERGGKGVNVKATKKRIRELEERQSSAWALGLE